MLLLLGGVLLSAYPALAQDNLKDVCGEAPVVIDQSLNAYVEAKGEVFSKRLADASIKANIEKTAHDVFQKYPDADRTRISEKLLNVFCYAIMGSPELSAKDKIDYWFKVKADFDRSSIRPHDLHNTIAISTLRYGNEYRYIMNECPLGMIVDGNPVSVDQLARIYAHFQGCAERLRNLSISNVDEELVDSMETVLNKYEMLTRFMSKFLPVRREIDSYRSIKKDLPPSLIAREETINREWLILKQQITGPPSSDDLEAMRLKMVRKYTLDFPPIT